MGSVCQKLCSSERLSNLNDNISGANFELTSPLLTSQVSKQISYLDFEKIDHLGDGAFGNVILVKKKSNNKIFAMKIIKKDQIITRNFIGKMNCEKKILLENKSPFLVRLKYSFQSLNKLYLVMEYCQGGDLYQYLKKHQRFTIEIAKFIASEIVIGLEYLHKEMNIIYRDLKPENILLTSDGHLKIADFGLGKQLKSKDELTYTFIGTQEYIAPEIINNQLSSNKLGYSQKCDIWAFGIFLYELINGKPPFMHPMRNWKPIMKQILENKVLFNKYFDKDSKDLIQMCLNSDPQQRPEWQQIKQHSFFRNIDWNLIKSRKYESLLKDMVFQQCKKQSNDAISIVESLTNKNIGQNKKFEGFTYDPMGSNELKSKKSSNITSKYSCHNMNQFQI